MTLPVYPNAISIDNLRTETAQTTGSLAAYLAGGGVVPLGTYGAPNGSNIQIPSSGPISLDSFHGYPATLSGHEILAWFWQNRAKLYVGGLWNPGPGSTVTYTTNPGDAYSAGAPYNSFNNFSSNATFSPQPPTLGLPFIPAPYWTTFVMHVSQDGTGGRPQFSGNWTSNTYGTWSTIQQGSFIGLGTITTTRLNQNPQTGMNGTIAWNNYYGGNNCGGVTGSFSLPGRWALVSSQATVPTSFTLGAGRLAVCLAWKNQDNFNMGGTQAAAGGNSFYVNNTWQYASTYLCQFNATSSPITCTNSGAMNAAGTKGLYIFKNLDNDS